MPINPSLLPPSMEYLKKKRLSTHEVMHDKGRWYFHGLKSRAAEIKRKNSMSPERRGERETADLEDKDKDEALD